MAGLLVISTDAVGFVLSEVFLGLYLGLLAGIVPALIAGLLGFLFRYVTGVSIPAFGVIVLAGAIAGLNGGLMGLIDEQILSRPRFLIGFVVVLMLSLYTHSQGDELGATLPRRISFRALRRHTLSADVIQRMGGLGTVTLTADSVESMAGYPPLSATLRSDLETGTWRFPADLPISELESRLAARLEGQYDLTDAIVSIDEEATAHIIAAPPVGSLSRRVPDGYRAVTVSGLVPTGIVRRDRLQLIADGHSIDGMVLSARSSQPSEHQSTMPDKQVISPTTGGDGAITVAVPSSQAEQALALDQPRLVVQSRGTYSEAELVSLLRRAGYRIEKAVVRPESPLVGGDVTVDQFQTTYGVSPVGIRRRGRSRSVQPQWSFLPDAADTIQADDELFVVGSSSAVAQFLTLARGGGSE